MAFELLHFRGAEEILKSKQLDRRVLETVQYLDTVMAGARYRRGLLRQTLAETGWRDDPQDLRFLPGRRYEYKGWLDRVAIESDGFYAYEYILPGLLRLQMGFATGLIDSGVLLLTAVRSANSPYGTSAEMVLEEMKLLYPTINLPVSVGLLDLEYEEMEVSKCAA